MANTTTIAGQKATIAENLKIVTHRKYSDFVTAPEIAETLGVTKEAVQKRFSDGTLRGYRLWGNKGPWRMRIEDFQQLLRENGTIIEHPTN